MPPESEPPLSATGVLVHASRSVAKLLPPFPAVLGWQYVPIGLPGVATVVDGGVGL